MCSLGPNGDASPGLKGENTLESLVVAERFDQISMRPAQQLKGSVYCYVV